MKLSAGCFQMRHLCCLLYSAGEDVKTVQKEVAEILQGRTLVGHAIHNDLKVHHYDVTYIE